MHAKTKRSTQSPNKGRLIKKQQKEITAKYSELLFGANQTEREIENKGKLSDPIDDGKNRG